MQIMATYVINNSTLFCDTDIATYNVAYNSEYHAQLKRNRKTQDNDTKAHAVWMSFLILSCALLFPLIKSIGKKAVQ